MKYRDYSASDFANDSFFISWVKDPDEESDWFWTSFVEENPACKPEIEKARELISSFRFPQQYLAEEEFKGMRNQILMALRAQKEEIRDKGVSRPFHFRGVSRQWVRVAAAITVVCLFVAGIFAYMPYSADHLNSLPDAEPGMEKRINPSGQKSVLFLTDGSKVWLNAASKIKYPKEFLDSDTREVYLEGEAFFDVAHDPEKPFIVHTSGLKIKVLGTSFNVKSYSDEKTIETTLLKGKVRIEQTDRNGNRIGDVELKPNQTAIFHRESKIIKVREVVGENTASWKTEKLVFDEKPMDDVIVQLERWYNVKVHVEGKGKLGCKLTANIEGESLRDVLDLIEASHAIHYRIEGTNVYIEGKLCEIDE